MRRPRPAIIVTALSALVLVSVPFGVAVAGSLASPSDVQAVGERMPLAAGQLLTEARAMTEAQTPFSRVEQVAKPVQPVPTSIVIPELDVRAPIDQVGVEADGWVEIPDDVARVGWYRFGVAPGSAEGSAVIVGHRDGWNEGAGALYDLARLEPGDVIQVERADSSTVTYAVVSREAIDKADLPTSELFAEIGDPRLTLISCIGYFDRGNGGYQQNIVVTALPVPEPALATTSSMPSRAIAGL